MLGRHKLIILASTLLFAVSASFASAAAIDNVVDHAIVTPGKKASLADISKNIIIAGLKRHWRMEQVGPNELKAVQANAKQQATVSITFTTTAYSIRLLDSAGLEQSGDSINRRYNGWVRYLTQDIDDQLTRASLTGQ